MERRIITTEVTAEDERIETTLRPQCLRDYVGQEKIKSTLNIYIEAAKTRGEPLDHVLFYGPPGLGKTTLAGIIANEMGTNMKVTSGPAIEKPGEMAAILNNLQEGDVLFVDETTTALSQKGRELVYKLMDDMRKQGKTVIFISHDMEELERMCDSISVLRDGNFVGTIQKEEITQDVLKRMMIGRDLTGDYYRSDCKLSYSDRVVLEVNGVSYGTSVQNISFQLHKGEILGLGGLTECGMHELCKIIFGAVKPDKGSVRLADGTEIKSPSVAIENKIAYMPKDRDLESLFLATSIKDNISMASLNKVKKGIFIPPKEERELADFNAKKLEVKMQNITQYVRELSGGNKQKVVVAKWMANDSEILIMDIGVKAAIYRLMEQLKKEGKSIIMVSEEMPELLGMSDRIIVMKDGKQTGQFDRSESLGEENLIHAML